MTPSDELRSAAETLRKITEQTSKAPWTTRWNEQQYEVHAPGRTYPIAEWTYAIATWEPQASEQRTECDTADADYIATMNPIVGRALAALLTEHASFASLFDRLWLARCGAAPAESQYSAETRKALAVARAINGGEA